MRKVALAIIVPAQVVIMASCNLSDGQRGRPQDTYQNEVSLGQRLELFPTSREPRYIPICIPAPLQSPGLDDSG
jgi:hypothetical protein